MSTSEHFSYDTYQYGNNPEFDFDVLTPGATAVTRKVTNRVTIDEDRYQQALEDINESLEILVDERSGKEFEVAVANLRGEDATVDLELSTFSSSITNNVGNAIEFAEHSAVHPSRRRVYVASFGNGGSSYWSQQEQDYIKKTGRFTVDGGAPLPTIAALGRVLRRAGLPVSRMSTNSAGGAFATALMSALPEGQVSHAYLKSRPNISNHRAALAWGVGMQLHEEYDKRQYAKNSQDSWRMTDAIRSTAQAKMPLIYGEDDASWTMSGALQDSGIKKLVTDMISYSHGGDVYRQPAANDTVLALRVQPEARLTYHFPSKDRLYGRNLRQEIMTFLGELVVPHFDTTQVEALTMPGTHHDHSAYPSLRWSIENYAFNR